MKKIQFIAIVAVLAALASSAGATVYSWIGGAPAEWATTNRWSPTSPVGGPSGAANSVIINGTNVVTVATATRMSPSAGGANVTVSDTATIERNSGSYMGVSGVLTFNGGSKLVANSLRLTNNMTLNWNSTNTFRPTLTNAAVAFANFQMPTNSINAGSVVNMSAGLWLLTNCSGQVNFEMAEGTFNMTGGKILCEDGFQIGTGSSAATFNLGGTGSVFVNAAGTNTSFKLFGAETILNFQGTNSSLYVNNDNVQGIKSYLTSKIITTNVYTDGVALTSINQLGFSTVNVDGLDYTKVTAIPEPATIGMILLGGVVAFFIRKRTA